MFYLLRKLIWCSIITLVCGFTAEVFAQADKTALEYTDRMLLANDMYNYMHVNDALEIYIKVLKENPDNASANIMAGLCYLKTVNKEKAIHYLQKAHYLNPLILHFLAELIEFKDEELEQLSLTDYILYLIAKAYHLSHDFDKAIEYYERYRTDVLKRDFFKSWSDPEIAKKELIKKIDRNIYECNNGKEFVKYPIGALIDNVGVVINTPHSEYIPLISADDSVLIFTSRRAGGTGWDRTVDHEFFEDIYISRKIGNYWVKPQNISSNINTPLHDACIALSPDAKQLFVYKTRRSGDIYLCDFKNGQWSNPKSLGKHINSKCNESSMSITADGQTLYFSSTKPDIYGDLDIFVSHKEKNGKWGKPTRLGPEINTEYDEDVPFILPDGKTLYFSSRGHKGMGDYDVFRSVLDKNGKWSEPENIGYPVNTADYDIYFVFSSDGKRGYFSSYRKGGYGEQDIYVVNLPDFFALFQRFDNDSLALIAMIRSYGIESKQLINEIVLNDILGAKKAKKMAQYLEIKKLAQSEVREFEKEFLQKNSTEVLALVVLEKEGNIIVMEEEEFMQKQKTAIDTILKDTTTVTTTTTATAIATDFLGDQFIFSSYYHLRIVDKSKITVEGGYIVDGITIGYYDQLGAFNFVKLSPDELTRLSAPEGSMLNTDRELVVDGITIGYYSEEGEFHYSNLSAVEIRKLSSPKGPILTKDRKLMVVGVTIGYYNEKGKFQFVNISPDEIKRLTPPEGTMLTADRKYVLNDITIGHYDKKGAFKFAKLSADEIKRLTPPPKNSLLTEDRKLLVYGITIGYYDEQGKFKVSNLSADELDKLGSIAAIAQSKNVVDEITVGCYDDQGEFKYIKLSPNEIRWLTSVEGAMITADGKYVVDGVTVGYSTSYQPAGGDSIPLSDSLLEEDNTELIIKNKEARIAFSGTAKELAAYYTKTGLLNENDEAVVIIKSKDGTIRFSGTAKELAAYYAHANMLEEDDDAMIIIKNKDGTISFSGTAKELAAYYTKTSLLNESDEAVVIIKSKDGTIRFSGTAKELAAYYAHANMLEEDDDAMIIIKNKDGTISFSGTAKELAAYYTKTSLLNENDEAVVIIKSEDGTIRFSGTAKELAAYYAHANMLEEDDDAMIIIKNKDGTISFSGTAKELAAYYFKLVLLAEEEDSGTIIIKNEDGSIRFSGTAKELANYYSSLALLTGEDESEIIIKNYANINISSDTANDLINKDDYKVIREREVIVSFGFNSTALLPQAKTKIDSFCNYLLMKDLKVEISGHTDNKGSEEYNLNLSEKRVQSGMKYLIEKGIKKEQLNIKIYGESKPMAPNTKPDGSDNPEGRRINRRIEIKIKI